MAEFFNTMEPMLRMFWFIALPVSIIFAIQSILTFTGGGNALDGVDADFDGDLDGVDAPFQLFSFRNLINFLLGFGWAGVSFYGKVKSDFMVVMIATLFGVFFIALFFIIMRQIQKLAEDNSFKIKNTLNKTAEVYLTIPAHKQGKGKVQITVNGAFHEIDAITEGEKIETGALIKVIKIAQDNIIEVIRI